MLERCTLQPVPAVTARRRVGANIARATEDLNNNGAIDFGEFSILIRIEGANVVTEADFLLYAIAPELVASATADASPKTLLLICSP